jgi:hypothetical protein
MNFLRQKNNFEAKNEKNIKKKTSKKHQKKTSQKIKQPEIKICQIFKIWQI